MGVNFALFSEHAERVELCLFDSVDAAHERQRVVLPERSHHVWHGYLPDVRPGQLYGYRVHGPHAPAEGHRFNPNKVLTDPYARVVLRTIRLDDAMFGYRVGDPKEDLSFDDRDNAARAPLCAVTEPAYIWGEDRPPRTPWHKTIIYETHVKGLTARHPEVPPELRGTYAGLATEPVIRYLTELGVTAVELMPIHHHVDDRHLIDRGLKNYWGYNTLSFFAPEPSYASPVSGYDVVREFKMMVRALHAAGLEVILDVAYNHTAEGNRLGPTLSLRGIDNRSYYRLVEDEPRHYMDFTGCGNTLNMQRPQVLRLIMDSLRYWILEMHIDGFRFDLASALARELYEVDRLGSFFDIIHQDPVISQAKLIAEPWDLGEGGYQVGRFPVLWTEWNAKYRDAARAFWKGGRCLVSEMATRLSGSSDLYEHTGRRPHASINFVTCHDGFTLRDLVSYDRKHNEANGEENRDGEDHNLSWNCGVEGPTDDPAVTALRARQARNLMATLMFSQGVPMISGGDELGRTQLGNNNAYCHDSEVSWYNWSPGPEDRRFLDFVRRVIAIRKRQPVFQRRHFFEPTDGQDDTMKRIYWLTPDDREMAPDDWARPKRCTLGLLLTSGAVDDIDAEGRKVSGDSVLLLFNADSTAASFVLSARGNGSRWERLLDTAREPVGLERRRFWKCNETYRMTERSLALFRLDPREDTGE
jgi:glycogen operon protein